MNAEPFVQLNCRVQFSSGDRSVNTLPGIATWQLLLEINAPAVLSTEPLSLGLDWQVMLQATDDLLG